MSATNPEPAPVRFRRLLERLRRLGVNVDGLGYNLMRPLDREVWKQPRTRLRRARKAMKGPTT